MISNRRGKASVKIIIAVVVVFALIIGMKFLNRGWIRFKADTSFKFTIVLMVIVVLFVIYLMIKFKINKRKKEKQKK